MNYQNQILIYLWNHHPPNAVLNPIILRKRIADSAAHFPLLNVILYTGVFLFFVFENEK